MARTITEIYDQLLIEKQANATLTTLQPAIDDSQTLLADLTSTSKVAIWRLWFWIMAYGIYVHENLFDVFTNEITELSTQIITGTPIWYQATILNFQYGDSLTWNGSQYVYNPITPANRIITSCAVVDLGYQIRIKLAKDNGGNPVPLTGAELASATAYINQIKFAGTSTAVTSSVGDDFKVDLTIQYDSAILTNTGELISTPGVFPVEDAIKNHIKTLPFNGILNLTALVDSIQNATGVIDPVLNSASAKYAALPYAVINANYTADAGYLILDLGSSIITYQTTVI